MAAKLEIEFEGDVLGNGYYLGANVQQAEEVPSRSLVFQRGSTIQRERLVRVASLDDLDLPETNAPHDIFRGPSLQTKDWVWPPVSGVYQLYLFYLDITHPEWVKLGASPTMIYTVVDILENNVVRVDTPFPAFGNQLHYLGYHFDGIPYFPTPGVEYPQDGIADRHYTESSDIYYRTDSSFAILDTLTDAENRKTSLKAEAQSLVDAANETYPTYAGDDTYDYS